MQLDRPAVYKILISYIRKEKFLNMQKKLLHNCKFLFPKFQLLLERSVTFLYYYTNNARWFQWNNYCNYGTIKSKSVLNKWVLTSLQPKSGKCHSHINCKLMSGRVWPWIRQKPLGIPKTGEKTKTPFGEGSLAGAPAEKWTSLKKTPHPNFEY